MITTNQLVHIEALIKVSCLVYIQVQSSCLLFLAVDAELKSSFDVVVADPPFLNEDCLTKTAQTIRLLAKNKVILCTGNFKIVEHNSYCDSILF